MRNDVASVNRRREVAVEGIRKHLKAEAAKGLTPKDQPLTPEHTAKHKAWLHTLEERIKVRARFRKYIDRKPNTGLTSAPKQPGTDIDPDVNPNRELGTDIDPDVQGLVAYP